MSVHPSFCIGLLLALVPGPALLAVDGCGCAEEGCGCDPSVPGECRAHGPHSLLDEHGVEGTADWSAHVHMTVYYDTIHSAANPALDGISDLHAHSHFDFGWRAADALSVVVGLKVEEDEDAPGVAPKAEDRWLADHQAFIHQAYAAWKPGNGVEVFAGKFPVETGLNHHAIPGLYGYETFEEYALLERVGLGAAYAWGEHGGLRQRIALDAFMADPTALSESALHDRGHLNLADGGAGNTQKLDNFALRYAGAGAPCAKGLGYALAVASQGPGTDGTEREWRGVASLDWQHRVADGVNLRLLAEYVQFHAWNGQAGQHNAVSTLGAEATLAAGSGQFILGGTWSWLAEDDTSPGAADANAGSSWQASAGYGLNRGAFRGLRIDVGYKSVNGLADEDQDKVGVGLTYHRAF